VNEGVSLKLTVLNKEQKSAIIYFGGNAETVDNNVDEFSLIFPSHAVYLFKYRGYSGSGGEPTEAGNYSDALALYDKIKEQYADISIIGRSLGSGVATYLASKREIKKLVLITPFDSLESVAQEAYRMYPMSLLVKDKYDSFSRAKEIKSSILIIMAEHDQVIGKEHTKRLIRALPASQLKVEIIRNAGHNNISNQDLFYSLLENNFKE
jgi:pimeloyl-ACP methyl ester carboxylesterase